MVNRTMLSGVPLVMKEEAYKASSVLTNGAGDLHVARTRAGSVFIMNCPMNVELRINYARGR